MNDLEAKDPPRGSQRGIGTNFVFNLAGTVFPIALSVAIVPLYISRIGADRYGIMSLVWVLLGYFGFLDFGLSRASANALSRLSTAGPAERVPVLMTAFYLNLALGAFGGLVIYVVGHFAIGHMAALSGPFEEEIRAAFPWMACMLPLSMIAGVGTGAIESRERFFVSNLFTSFGGLLAQILPITCAILFGPSLIIIVPAAFAGRFITTLAVWAYVFWAERPVHLGSFDRRQVRSLLGYGAWVSVTGMISPVLDTFDQLLIGALLGSAAIAHYSVPMNMTTRSQFIAVSLAKTLFPRLSRVESEEADRLTIQATVTLAFGFAAVCAPTIVLAGPFLTLWLGNDFAQYASPVAIILLLGGWTNGVAFIPFTFLQSRGRPDLPAKIHTGEVLPFLATVWILTKWLGLPGAALAWTLRVTIDLLLILFVGKLFRPPLAATLPAVGLMAMSYAIAEWIQPTGLHAFLIACGIGSVVVCSALICDHSSRSLALSILLRMRASRPGTFFRLDRS